MTKYFALFGCVALFAAGCSSSTTPEATSVKTPATTLANPASVNCGKVGGTLEIVDEPNGQYGLCHFEDNRSCEEWALMRGDCPVGGVKTTGFDTDAQKYCAWIGGQTLAVPDAKCTLKSGKVCPVDDVYQGKCS